MGLCHLGLRAACGGWPRNTPAGVACRRHPEPHAVTLDRSITEHWRVAGCRGEQDQAGAAALPFCRNDTILAENSLSLAIPAFSGIFQPKFPPKSLDFANYLW